ncbi:hypothetical protein [Glaciecola sp. KUL10]|uniref:hypothetical protein n=1 Tax=Glaciecola sp. (strain KUL10) TaxID=2161813 RepID=UPI000D78B5B3|nr:hypothetical protein [Glaciecola sp. KUL10]
MGPGLYSVGIIIRHDNVVLSGMGAHFVAATKEGKATFVVKGNNVLIEDVECSQVRVRDQNGACIRQEGRDLTLNNVYFHNSEQGVLQAGNTGSLTIRNSRFEALGNRGRAHSVYSNGEMLTIINTKIIGSKDQAHAVKSRSKVTRIIDSIISSGDADDSRLFDISSGGEFEIVGSVLYQGRNTVNSQLIGFGLENIGRQRRQIINVRNSVILAERPNGNILLGIRDNLPNLSVEINNNLIIGSFWDVNRINKEDNFHFESRKSIGLKDDAFPTLGLLQAAHLGLFE